MINPEKIGFVFDNSLGFSDEFSAILTGSEESLYDGPIYYGSSYTHLCDTNYKPLNPISTNTETCSKKLKTVKDYLRISVCDIL